MRIIPSKFKIKIPISLAYELLMHSDLRSLKWMVAIMSFIFGVTLIIYPPLANSSDVEFLRMMYPTQTWGVLFIAHSALKLWKLLHIKPINSPTFICNVAGLVLWSYAFAIAAFIGAFSLTDVLFLIPILAQGWFIADNLGEIKKWR